MANLHTRGVDGRSCTSGVACSFLLALRKNDFRRVREWAIGRLVA